MAPPEETTSDGTGEHRTSDRDAGAEEWFAASTLRIALAIIGLVVVLFALGQAVGMNLLGMFADALSTQIGRWLVVAFFGLLLIALAVRGFGLYRD